MEHADVALVRRVCRSSDFKREFGGVQPLLFNAVRLRVACAPDHASIREEDGLLEHVTFGVLSLLLCRRNRHGTDDVVVVVGKVTVVLVSGELQLGMPVVE